MESLAPGNLNAAVNSMWGIGLAATLAIKRLAVCWCWWLSGNIDSMCPYHAEIRLPTLALKFKGVVIESGK